MSEHSAHLSADHIQDWLDGRLSAPETNRVEAHLARCALCREEAVSWRALLDELYELPALAPGPGFPGRVLDAIGRASADRIPLAARTRTLPLGGFRRRLAAWLGRGRSAATHPGQAGLQDFVEEALGRRRAAAVRRHLEACPDCRAEVSRWRTLLDGLNTLPRFAPSPAFTAAVMSNLRIPEPTPARTALPHRLLDRVRALAGPRQHRAWAAAAGVAFTPVVTAGAVAYAVFSHPLVTVGNLVTFVWLEGSALACATGGGLTAGLVESGALFNAWTTLDLLSRSPGAAGARLAGFCSLTLAAGWVLYRNLITPDRQAVHARR